MCNFTSDIGNRNWLDKTPFYDFRPVFMDLGHCIMYLMPLLLLLLFYRCWCIYVTSPVYPTGSLDLMLPLLSYCVFVLAVEQRVIDAVYPHYVSLSLQE